MACLTPLSEIRQLKNANSVHSGTVSLKVSSSSWWLGNPRRLGLTFRNRIRLRSHVQIIRIILFFSADLRLFARVDLRPKKTQFAVCMSKETNCGHRDIWGQLQHAAEFAIPGSRLLPPSELSLSAYTRRKVWVVSVSGADPADVGLYR